ncbi:MAG: 16S rRNA (uracil(1498)-N(3))-methyltransferase [Negativicutes bacterium]|nr:16S rRNA (uracil(1498)-N(3))-methyltransferase [Negativicutes bacterium]
MRRFFVDAPLSGTVTLQGRDAHHIGRVLRLSPGAEIVVAGQDGQACRARITAVGPDTVTAQIGAAIEQRHEPPIEVWLAQGLPKGDKLEYIVQKAVEIGAAGVIPMAADFSTVKYDETKQAAKRERWQKIAGEAAKQCGRDLVPTVTPIRSLGEVLAQAGPDTAIIMLYEAETNVSLKAVLTGCRAKSYLLLVGPEGGFSPAEARLCREKGVSTVTLGPRILRTETASLAALAAVLYQNGDLGG